jgi:hypothetical protein
MVAVLTLTNSVIAFCHCLEVSTNRTEFVDQRREMLQAWADYLDELRDKKRTQSSPL